MDAKSKLQQKVLALRRGYTARDIKYASTRTKDDTWRATVRISHLKFPITSPFYNKRSAETAAAQNILNSWPKVSKTLKKPQKKNEKYSFPEAAAEEEAAEKEESGLSQADYIELGKLAEKRYHIKEKMSRIIQKKYS